MSESGAPFRKNQIKKLKNSKNQNEIPICEQKFINEKWKFGSNQKTKPRTNYEWSGKTI